MKNKFLIMCFITLLLCGCRNTWHKIADRVWEKIDREMEREYGEPRTTFYTCPLSDRNPRIPIINPVEMFKDEELGWTLRTIGLNADSVWGDYHQIDLMYGDSSNIYLHAGELHYTVNSYNFYQSEKWFILQIHEKKLIGFSEKNSLLQKVGKETVEKMISPDNYYELFHEDANSLPWIPVIK